MVVPIIKLNGDKGLFKIVGHYHGTQTVHNYDDTVIEVKLLWPSNVHGSDTVKVRSRQLLDLDGDFARWAWILEEEPVDLWDAPFWEEAEI